MQYQSWGDHLQKSDATIAANQTPDVTAEMGNTEMTKQTGGGSLCEHHRQQAPSPTTRATWLAGLKKSSMFNNKLYAEFRSPRATSACHLPHPPGPRRAHLKKAPKL